MVKEITSYEDSSGKLHRTAADAHRAELAIWLAAEGTINEASAKALADRMVANAPVLIDTLQNFTRDVVLKAPGSVRQMAVVA